MTDTWEHLINNSSIENGDAWNHITHPNKKDGGNLVLTEGLEISLYSQKMNVEIEKKINEIEITELNNNILVEQLKNQFEVQLPPTHYIIDTKKQTKIEINKSDLIFDITINKDGFEL